MTREMHRSRQRNFKQPDIEQVDASVLELIESGRAIAVRDHRGTFASNLERDLVTEVYFQRALGALKDMRS